MPRPYGACPGGGSADGRRALLPAETRLVGEDDELDAIRSPSLVIARLTWVLAVSGLMISSAPISSLDSPRATSATTSRSRWVSRASRSGPTGSGPRRACSSSMTRAVTAGASRRCPSATVRTAARRSSGSTSLSRNPLAPARSASNTCSSRSNVVRTSTLTPSRWGSPTMRRVASRPSTKGMRMSISTTPGRVARHDLDRLGAVGGVAHHVDVVGQVEQRPEAGAHDGLVVGDDDADAHADPPTGSTARTRNPPPSAAPCSTRPPTAAARSRIPRSPKPSELRPSPGASRPWPSSTTSISSAAPARRSRTSARAAPECRMTFVTASCTMRNAVSSTIGGRSPSTSRRTETCR